MQQMPIAPAPKSADSKLPRLYWAIATVAITLCGFFFYSSAIGSGPRNVTEQIVRPYLFVINSVIGFFHESCRLHDNCRIMEKLLRQTIVTTVMQQSVSINLVFYIPTTNICHDKLSITSKFTRNA